MGTKEIITVLAALCASPHLSVAEDDLTLPQRGDNAPRPPVVAPGTGGTLHLKPNGVATPPGGKAARPKIDRRPGGPARWRYLPSRPAESTKAGPAGDPESPPIRAIILIPGVHTADVREGSTREFARALPVPEGFAGIRDLGTGTPKDVSHQFKKFLGRPGDAPTIDKLIEIAVFLYGASGHEIKAVHIHDTPEEDGIVRLVVVGPAVFAAR